MIDVEKIANQADMIINGYAFTWKDNQIRVLNLDYPQFAAVFDQDLNAVETTMDDIELEIVTEYLWNDLKYMEA